MDNLTSTFNAITCKLQVAGRAKAEKNEQKLEGTRYRYKKYMERRELLVAVGLYSTAFIIFRITLDYIA